MINPVRGSNSAPAARVLEIVEFLVRANDSRPRFVDISRELGINQATVHSILKTLCDQGWATRDPVDKSFSAGPALAALAMRTGSVWPTAQAARAAIADLAHETDYPASVIERLGTSLAITAFESGDMPHPGDIPGDRIPFVPPFGVAFAAWDPIEDQEAWIRRAQTADESVNDRLHEMLSQTRRRGFDIDWMTPTLIQAAQAITTVSRSAVPEHIRHTLEQLRGEFTTIGHRPDNESDWTAQPIATISAPVIDQWGRPALVIAVHPMRALGLREVNSLGRRLTTLTAAIDVNLSG